MSAGFTSGLLLSVVIWLKDWFFHWVERRDQIRYLAALIENYMKLIYDADGIDALHGNFYEDETAPEDIDDSPGRRGAPPGQTGTAVDDVLILVSGYPFAAR